jgi:hypothetical protein
MKSLETTAVEPHLPIESQVFGLLILGSMLSGPSYFDGPLRRPSRPILGFKHSLSLGHDDEDGSGVSTADASDPATALRASSGRRVRSSSPEVPADAASAAPGEPWAIRFASNEHPKRVRCDKVHRLVKDGEAYDFEVSDGIVPVRKRGHRDSNDNHLWDQVEVQEPSDVLHDHLR